MNPSLVWIWFRKHWCRCVPQDPTFLDDPRGKRELYIEARDRFNGNDPVLRELRDWKTGKHRHYEHLNGLIPSNLWERSGGSKRWKQGDTFFSEYKNRFPENILHETEESLIILNKASHDRRQYPDYEESAGCNNTTPEGQGFGHMLIIPKIRVFNVVDPDAVAQDGLVIRELRGHFEEFWSDTDRKELVQRMRQQEEAHNRRREDEAAKLGRLKEAQKTTRKLRRDFEHLSQLFTSLNKEDFILGFHPNPEHSIGHLHLHAFPERGVFRKHSAVRHDRKTIPIDDILEVEVGHSARRT